MLVVGRRFIIIYAPSVGAVSLRPLAVEIHDCRTVAGNRV